MKIIHSFFIVFFVMGASFIQARPSVSIQNVAARQCFSLDGKWNYIIDPYETGYYDYRYKPYDEQVNPGNGAFYLDKKPANKSDLIEYSFDKSPTLWVPGDWNSQDEKLLYYEGTIWYRRIFDYQKKSSDDRVLVYFGAANYESDVYLNGKKLGKHIGGFTPFCYEITDLLRETGNSLVVKVDNKRKREAVPTLNTDWWNYGGITRDVSLIEVPHTYISDYLIHLQNKSDNVISGYIQLNEDVASQQVTVSIPELKLMTTLLTDSHGKACFNLKATHLERWSPEDPKLYQVEVSLGENKVIDQIGFRTIETKGTDILLNGKSVFLRGISIHAENPQRGGRAYSDADVRELLDAAKALNCNFVRLAHYPHSENMIRLADKMGILVWEEDPVYWTIQWENPDTYANAQQQLTDVIERDKNRACVIIWSMANETPVSDARTLFLKKLAQQARSLDNSRLISAALEVHGNPVDPNERIVEDPFADVVDVVSFNEYVGWYDGLPEKCDKIHWSISYNKPVLISEFGGGALQGLHGDAQTRWTEEYQEDIYARTVKMLSKIPQFRGTSPWILFDFRSPKRVLPGIQDGWNRKGLISENGVKKKAFYVLRDFYNQMEAKFAQPVKH